MQAAHNRKVASISFQWITENEVPGLSDRFCCWSSDQVSAPRLSLLSDGCTHVLDPAATEARLFSAGALNRCHYERTWCHYTVGRERGSNSTTD